MEFFYALALSASAIVSANGVLSNTSLLAYISVVFIVLCPNQICISPSVIPLCNKSVAQLCLRS